MTSRQFRLDRRNGKIMGLFAGLANYTGLDANIMRIAFVLLAVAGGWKWMIAAYFGACWAACISARKSEGRRFDSEAPQARGSIHALRTEMTDTDRRLAEIERYTASPNTGLAREIDSLR